MPLLCKYSTVQNGCWLKKKWRCLVVWLWFWPEINCFLQLLWNKWEWWMSVFVIERCTFWIDDTIATNVLKMLLVLSCLPNVKSILTKNMHRKKNRGDKGINYLFLMIMLVKKYQLTFMGFFVTLLHFLDLILNCSLFSSIDLLHCELINEPSFSVWLGLS